MIVSELKLYNFRKFRSNGDTPGLIVTFHRGLNALIGENDSGKTAIIDALKLVLHTQSNEYIRPIEDDFYTDENGASVDEFKIHCTISYFEPNEAKNFIEYLSFEKDKVGGIHYFLKLYFRAWRDAAHSTRIYSELKVGDEAEGISIEGKARELLKVVYLKPLRDAEREMSAGRGSRISQILLSHPIFRTSGDEEHDLIKIFRKANEDIEKYFSDDDEEGRVILRTIRSHLEAFNDNSVEHGAELIASDVRLRGILESLSLNMTEVHPGLGELNLLFIAAELLLLNEDTEGGLRLALIEELEAHLHPQAQLRLISFLQNEYTERGSQIIISTHSPILASKINLKSIILLKDNQGYDLAVGKTGLSRGDYLFLQKFLDATKANLFFAKGIIMVEGDAENLLIPVIAELIGYPLEKYGVSMVNVGSTAFLRYSRILVRANGSTIGIPVSVITDCDVRPYKVEKDRDGKNHRIYVEKDDESAEEIEKKTSRFTEGSIRAFVSPLWTFEYCIAMSCLNNRLHRAILYAKKIYNSEEISLTDKKIREADKEADDQLEEWKDLSDEQYALNIFSLMLGKDGKSALKAITAQCLASILKWEVIDKSFLEDEPTQENMFDMELYQMPVDEEKRKSLAEEIMDDEYLSYIVNAIRYAVGEDSDEA